MIRRRAVLAGGAAALAAEIAPGLVHARSGARLGADVAVIGAGLAGLAAARLLEAAGARVVVVEAERRVGGRLHTLDDLPGAPEAGGIQVGQGYAILRRIAGELGVGLVAEEGAGAGIRQLPGNLYHVNAITVPGTRWATSKANRLEGEARSVEPAALARLYYPVLPQLAAPEAWMEAPREADISLRQALVAGGASGEALRLIGANFNGNSLASMSQLHLARTLAIYAAQAGPVSTIAGGSQRLPEAMAASLGSEVRLGTAVRALEEEADGVTLHLEQGRFGGRLRARHVICTIPFAALRTVPLAGALEAPVARMIAALPYTRASFAYIAARTPFWREDGLPETLWTDDPLIGRVFVLSDGSDGGMPMLKLWTSGAGADLLDRLPPETAKRAIVERIGAMRPAARGQIEVLRLHSWQKSRFARGIYHHIGTGMASELARAVAWQGRRLHFAGEHLARASSGMEAALESGEAVARRVAGLL